jgi:5-methyltetrahydropteroyltriglutamate--homocysteine methyltransferase
MAIPYRADHIGSLLRPPELLQARTAYQQGRLTLDQLRQSEDTAILQALELQRQVGFGVFTDGEYRRGWFAGDLEESLEGLIADPEATADRRWQGQHREQANTTAAEQD